jgi:hypothetical protein
MKLHNDELHDLCCSLCCYLGDKFKGYGMNRSWGTNEEEKVFLEDLGVKVG